MMPDKNRILNWLSLPAGLLGLVFLLPVAEASSPAPEITADTVLQLARADDERDPNLERRLQEWRSMPQDKRERIKEKHQVFERLDPAEQQRLREEFRARKSKDRG